MPRKFSAGGGRSPGKHRSTEGIEYFDAADDFAGVQVFAEQFIAAGNACSLHDQRLIKREAARLMQIQRALNNGGRDLRDLELQMRFRGESRRR